jgi:hypothetical protein
MRFSGGCGGELVPLRGKLAPPDVSSANFCRSIEVYPAACFWIRLIQGSEVKDERKIIETLLPPVTKCIFKGPSQQVTMGFDLRAVLW